MRGSVGWREMEWEGDREREKEKWREMEQEEDRKGGDKVRKSCGTGTCSPDSSFLVWCGSLICVSLNVLFFFFFTDALFENNMKKLIFIYLSISIFLFLIYVSVFLFMKSGN